MYDGADENTVLLGPFVHNLLDLDEITHNDKIFGGKIAKNSPLNDISTDLRALSLLILISTNVSKDIPLCLFEKANTYMMFEGALTPLASTRI
jgi:hypothetical protein